MAKLFLILLAFLYSTFAVAECSSIGGDIDDCIARANAFPVGHKIPAGIYSSGGTYILKNASCVSPKAIFRFHSAYVGPQNMYVMRPDKNYLQIEQFNQYPRLNAYLEAKGTWYRVFPHTVINGRQTSILTGLPLCRSSGYLDYHLR